MFNKGRVTQYDEPGGSYYNFIHVSKATERYLQQSKPATFNHDIDFILRMGGQHRVSLKLDFFYIFVILQSYSKKDEIYFFLLINLHTILHHNKANTGF